MSNEIKINVIGKILEGDNENGYVLIQEDLENTGGYLIFISKDPGFTSTDGCDYWVEKYSSIKFFLRNQSGISTG